jgi:beta-galactosidase
MRKSSFNENWLVKKGTASPLMEMFQPSGEASLRVDLPYDAMIAEKQDPDTKSQGQTGFYPGKAYHYIKRFHAPVEWAGGHTLLELEGAYMQARVFVNGDYAGGHPHGYSNFYIDLDRFLKFGAENEIDVLVNNSQELNSRWYSGSGLYRGANILTSGPVHIKEDGARFLAPEVDSEVAVVTAAIEIANTSNATRKIKVETVITEPGGRAACVEASAAHVFSASVLTQRQRMYIKSPEMWDCDNPSLYQFTVRLLDGDTVLDEVSGTLGIRSLSLDPARGLRINGKSVKLRGACIHHDNGIIGASTYYRAEERRCLQLKEAGFNCIRSSHHPISKAMLDACDRHGMLVMDELSDMWTRPKNTNDYSQFFPDFWEKDVELMVGKDFNHPCVIIYSLGNEIQEIGTAHGAAINRRIAEKFKREDPSRYTTNALNGLIAVMQDMGQIMADITGMTPEEMARRAQQAAEAKTAGNEESSGSDELNGMMNIMVGPIADAMARHPIMTERLEEAAGALDIAGYNYLTGRHEMDGAIRPNRVVLGTETFPPDIARLWDIAKRNPHVIGDMTWTGYDYLGEAGIGVFQYNGKGAFSATYPDKAAYVGDIDLIGCRRPISYLREIVFGLRKEPCISVLRMNRNGQTPGKTAWMHKDAISSWTWPGFEGEIASIEVFSDAEEVELTLNGQYFGRQPAGEKNGYAAQFAMPYAPGDLTATAVRNGMPCESHTLVTAESATVLRIDIDRQNLSAGLPDLAYITITLADAKGNQNLFESQEITISVQGCGKLLGFGSADPQSANSYQNTAWATYDGYLLAAVRSTGEAGEIKIKVSSEACGEVEKTIVIS